MPSLDNAFDLASLDRNVSKSDFAAVIAFKMSKTASFNSQERRTLGRTTNGWHMAQHRDRDKTCVLL